MRCPAEGVVQLTEEYDMYKALHLTLTHRPLPGVNSTHVEWWFRSALPSTVVFRGRSWDAYKLWHPVDHILFARLDINDPRVDVGTLKSRSADWPPVVPAVHIVEQFRGPLTNASSPDTIAGSGAAVQAYGSGGALDNATVVTYPLDVTLVLNETRRNMHRLMFYMGSTVMQELAHTWEDSDQGLRLKSKFILGGRTPAAAELNKAVLATVFPQNWRQALMLHAVEEFGNMPYFLKEVYDEQTPTASAG